MNPIVSIIIPCFNQGQYIGETLESIDKCSEKGICEIIIVNDGSTDSDTITVLKELGTKGYHIINQSNRGVGSARNTGIKAAKGKYILPLDSDNKIRPGFIQECVTIFDNEPAIDVVYSDKEYFGEKKGVWESGDFNLQHLMIENFIDACSVFRKSTFERVGGYDEKMPVMGYEDWDLWLSIAFQNGQFRYINKVLFDYRYNAKSMIHTLANEKLSATIQYLEEKYNNYLNRNYLNRLILFKASKHRGLAFQLAMKSFFPRISNILRKAGIMKSKDII